MPNLTCDLYEFGDFCLDTRRRILRRGSEALPLTPKSLDVLWLLIQSGGKVVTKDELMKAVWPDRFVEESNLTQTIFMLRKALGETLDQRYIVTIPGRGYRFTAEVKAVPNDRSAEPLAESAVSSPSAGSTGQSPSAPAAVQIPGHQPRRLRLMAAGGLTLLVVAVAAGLWVQRSRDRALQPLSKITLAVLPFENLTGDPSQEYFSDGMTEEMITQLSVLDSEHLGVIARTSVMAYKHNPKPLDQVGRELGVQYVLEGSVRRDGGRARVTAQLIRVQDQTHLWARQYDRELTDLLVLQGEIARATCDEIQAALGDHKRIVLPAQPSLSPQGYEAHELYLKGLYFWNQRTTEGFQRAIDYFEQAIEKDPNNARAYTGLADSYALIGGYSGIERPEFAVKAKAAALRALQIDPNLSEAHTAFALVVENYNWDWQTAEREYQRAIALNPNYATAHHWYAEYLAWRGRFDEALEENERARQLDPFSLIIAADRGKIFYYSRQYDRAIQQFLRLRDMDPYFSRNPIVLAYVEKGMVKEALAIVQGPSGDVPSNWARDAYVFGHTGQQAQAQYALEKLLQLNRHEPVNIACIVTVYLAMGHNEQALAWLQRAYTEQPNVLTRLKVDPEYDPLRSDPRFQDLLRRVGLSQ